MTFYTFTNGTIANATQVNSNFNGVLYSILYNRMENDTAGNIQLNNCIISDIFTNVNGCYNTICSTDATSYYDSTNCAYVGVCYTNDISVTYDTNYCTFCYDYNWLCITANSSKTTGCAYIYGYDNDSSPRCATGYACYNTNNVILTDCVDDYCYIKINYCRCQYACSDALSCYTCSYINYNIGSLNYCCIVMARCYNCNVFNNGSGYLEYCKTGDNTFNYYINGICQCEITNLNLNWSFQGCVKINGGGYNHVCQRSISYINLDFTLFKIESVNFPTNTQIFDSPKSTVYFVTNSTIPTGACITVDIYNQDGCLYATDVIPKTITSLTTADSCCFYAVIKQNKGNSTTPISTTNYAILFE